jgi:hypothetical protein
MSKPHRVGDSLDDAWECEECGDLFTGEPAKVIGPLHSSPDGLPKYYCASCVNDDDDWGPTEQEEGFGDG